MYFDKGLLSRARTDSGELLKWNRTSNGEVESVESDARPGQSLISAVYDNGLLKSLHYNESAGVSFGYDKMPVVASSAGNDIISTLKPSLSLIKDTTGEEGSFQCNLDADLKQIKMVIDQKSIEGPRPQEEYLWSTSTKKLLSDIESTYDYDFEHGATNHRPIIQRRYNDQTFEEYHYDSNKGVMRNRSRDGSVLEKFYVATPSKAFGLIRNTVFTPAGAGGRPVVLFRGILDNEGYYIRATQMSDLPGLAKETRYNKHEVVSENWIPQKIEFANNGTTVLPFRGGQLEFKLLPLDGKDGGDRRAAGKGYEIVLGADDMVKQVTVPEGIKYKVLKTASGACEIAVEYQGQTGTLGKLQP